MAAAQAQVRNNEAALERERASLTNLEARYERLNTLFGKGFVAGQEVDNARTAVEVQRKQLEVVQAQIAAAKSSVESAQALLTATANQAAIVRGRTAADIKSGRADVARVRATVRIAQANRANNPAFQENLSALQANVSAAESQLRQARTQLSEAVIRSSVNGVVTARNADPGTIATPGQAVLVVQTIDTMYVLTAVPLEQSISISMGQTARITFSSLKDQTFTGTVTNINPAANVQSRQVQIRLRLENPGRVIKPGMYANIGFVTERRQVAVAVPREAVTTANGASTVTVVDDEGTAQVREVVLGANDTEKIEIKSGLKVGEKVVTLTYQPVRDAMKVRLPGQPSGEGSGQGGGGGGVGARRTPGAGQ